MHSLLFLHKAHGYSRVEVLWSVVLPLARLTQYTGYILRGCLLSHMVSHSQSLTPQHKTTKLTGSYIPPGITASYLMWADHLCLMARGFWCQHTCYIWMCFIVTSGLLRLRYPDFVSTETRLIGRQPWINSSVMITCTFYPMLIIPFSITVFSLSIRK